MVYPNVLTRALVATECREPLRAPNWPATLIRRRSFRQTAVLIFNYQSLASGLDNRPSVDVSYEIRELTDAYFLALTFISPILRHFNVRTRQISSDRPELSCYEPGRTIFLSVGITGV